MRFRFLNRAEMRAGSVCVCSDELRLGGKDRGMHAKSNCRGKQKTQRREGNSLPRREPVKPRDGFSPQEGKRVISREDRRNRKQRSIPGKGRKRRKTILSNFPPRKLKRICRFLDFSDIYCIRSYAAVKLFDFPPAPSLKIR